MDQSQLNWIANFIWNIADDLLRDVYVRGKYRDVILPMTVLRRLDAVLEPTKDAVLEMKAALDREQVANQDDALRAAADQAFYNTSAFLLRDLKSRASQQQLRADFEAYLDGFSPNVQEILNNFEFRNQIPRLSNADVLGSLIEKFLDKDVNLSPSPTEKLPALDNHSMGTIFEELVRRFNEENNEEAGEHWTPRDAVRLMARLVIQPIADKIESGTYLVYDCACGTGGMLTVAEETLRQVAKEHGKQVATHLYGQDINAETYAICKADMLLKGEGDNADNIVGGPAFSTLSNDAFRSRTFDFMLANPPYGKSWKSDVERMGGKKGIRDPRFVFPYADDPEYSLVTRSSDGQLMFLANMLSKMKEDTPLGGRVAEVHNGSSLFTGDAGQGESNTRSRSSCLPRRSRMEIVGRKAFEVWINEETDPQGGKWDSWDVCIEAVKDCDILIVISNGNAGWAEGSGAIGICHAEMMTGLSIAPAKVRLIAVGNIPITKDDEGKRNKRFQDELAKQSLFRGGTVATVDDLKDRVKAALHDAVIKLAQAGVSDASKGKFHSGAALDWSRLSFSKRQAEMVRVLREALLTRKGSFEDSGKLFVSFGNNDVLVEPLAIPDSLSVGPARELVGQPFLSDYLLAPSLTGKRGGPLHVIACHKGATESQARKLLGFPDATFVAAPFGIYVADSIQMVQFAFITDCRDEANTRHGLQRFLEWLSQSGEETRLADRALARARIVRAIAKEAKP